MGHIWFHWNINFFKDFFFFFFFWLPGLQLTALILISCSSSTCWAAILVVLKQSREVCPQWRRWLSWIAKWWRRWKTLQKVNLKRWLMDSWESATVRSTCSREVALAFVIFSIYHHVFFFKFMLACMLTNHSCSVVLKLYFHLCFKNINTANLFQLSSHNQHWMRSWKVITELLYLPTKSYTFYCKLMKLIIRRAHLCMDHLSLKTSCLDQNTGRLVEEAASGQLSEAHSQCAHPT